MPKLCLLANAASSHTEKWAVALSKRGWTVHIISFIPAEIPHVQVHLVPRAVGGKADVILRIRWVVDKIRQLKPDILHAHYATSFGFLGALSGWHPFIISAWGSDIFSFPRTSLFHRFLLKWILRQADYLCSTSQVMAQEMEAYVDRRIEIIPFGVDTDHFAPAWQEPPGGPAAAEVPPGSKLHAHLSGGSSASSAPVVFGVAKYLEPVYGLDILLRAFARLCQEHPGKALLRIAGSGSAQESLHSLAQSLGVADYVEWLGAIPNHSVADFYKNLDVVVVPSRQESFGVTAVEGSACGLPIIASRVGGLPEVVIDGETGLLIPSENVDKLYAAMNYLMASPEERRRLGKAGREFVLSRYDFQENVSRMEDVYKRALNARKGLAG